MISSAIAARLPGLHEQQERQETLNILGAGLGEEFGVSERSWGDDLWSVRATSMPEHPPGNQLTGLTLDTVSRLPEILPWFDEVGCSMRIRLPAAQVDHELGQSLAALGFAVDEVEAWMAAPLDTLQVSATEHDIRLVDSAHDAVHFGNAFRAGWGITAPEVSRVALAAMAPWPGPPSWRRYVGWLDSEPAAEALLVSFGELAYLAEAATAPRFRRRGLQRALIARRAADARALGCTVLFSAVQYGDASWSNMRSLGLREATMTLTLRRPAR